RLYHNEGWETYDYNYQEYMQIANQDKKIQLIEQVKKLKEYFPKKDYSYMYQNDELELIIVSPNIDNSDDPHYGGYRYIGMTSDYYYKIVFKSLEEIAKLNGAKDLEVRRRRLEKGEKLTKQDWFKMSEVIKFNRESKQKNYSREILPLAYRISPEQDFVILFQDRNDNDGIDWGTIFEKEKLSDIKFITYKPNYTIIYGSADEENPPEGKQEKLELWGGTHHCYKYRKSPKEDISIAKQLISNPDVETFINGHKIGQNLERELEWESYFDQCQDQQKYRETIELEDDMILDLKYTYDLNGGFISLFKKTRFAFLKIEYRCIEKKNKEREFKEYDTLLIKEFDVYNQDYGIAIPDEVVVKAGFHSQQEESQEPKQKQIEVEKYNQNKAENKKGKLLIDGKPVTSLGLEKNEREIEDYIVCIVKSSDDYLANLAHEWLGSPLRWKELEKQPGTCFTEGEQYTLQKGTKIYVPKEKVRKYKKNCKHCRWSLVEKVVNYIYGEMMTNLKSSSAEFIKEKLAFIEQEKTWRDVLKWSDNFKEVGKEYYKWYELVKTKGDWDHKEYILENYSDWSCDLLKQEMYQYDIWSNIHYGYLGLAVGFKKWELLSGAGVAQAKQGFDNVPEGYLRRRFEKIGDADFLAALDDPKDQASIEIGFELWENHGEDLNKEHLIEAIRNSKAGELAKKSCSSG
ncbi:MAG: polymorphic toxin type 44 domain-containing protein, partial [Bacillota bacterium]